MSMKDIGIYDGDLLAVHTTREARNGQIVVARVGDEVTVKRFKRDGKKVWLLAENPEFAPSKSTSNIRNWLSKVECRRHTPLRRRLCSTRPALPGPNYRCSTVSSHTAPFGSLAPRSKPKQEKKDHLSELSLSGSSQHCHLLLTPILRELGDATDSRWLTLIAPPAFLSQSFLRKCGLNRERMLQPRNAKARWNSRARRWRPAAAIPSSAGSARSTTRHAASCATPPAWARRRA